MEEPIRVGLIGAGPWAEMVHAPGLADDPTTELTGVWARRPEAAAALARAHGSRAVGSPEELAAMCDAVVFCVPPDVQAELAPRIAARGRTFLLEKPLAIDLASAERLHHTLVDAGVKTMLALTWSYSPQVRSFAASVRDTSPTAAEGRFISSALVEGPFRTPWRLEQGPLLDTGPHIMDVLETCLGPIVEVGAQGDRREWVHLTFRHASGVMSSASLSSTIPLARTVAGVEVFGSGGRAALDMTDAVGDDTFAVMRSELVALVRHGTPPAADSARGLHLQRLLEQADRQLRLPDGPRGGG